MPMTGDMQKLERLLKQCSAAPQIPRQAARAALPAVKHQLEEQFETTATPTGKEWKPLKRPMGLPPLWGLKDFFLAAVIAASVVIRSSKFYAVFHQKGTRTIPPRQFLPEGKLSASWKAALSVPIKALIHRLLGT